MSCPVYDETQEPSDALTNWKERGRAEKVLVIVAALDAGAYGEGVDPHADAESIARKLRALDSLAWHEIQREAGFQRKKPPSDKTRQAIIDTNQRRVDIAGEFEP